MEQFDKLDLVGSTMTRFQIGNYLKCEEDLKVKIKSSKPRFIPAKDNKLKDNNCYINFVTNKHRDGYFPLMIFSALSLISCIVYVSIVAYIFIV